TPPNVATPGAEPRGNSEAAAEQTRPNSSAETAQRVSLPLPSGAHLVYRASVAVIERRRHMPGKKNGVRNLVSFKDVQIAHLTEGLAGVEELVSRGEVSKPTIRRALKKLQE